MTDFLGHYVKTLAVSLRFSSAVDRSHLAFHIIHSFMVNDQYQIAVSGLKKKQKTKHNPILRPTMKLRSNTTTQEQHTQQKE